MKQINKSIDYIKLNNQRYIVSGDINGDISIIDFKTLKITNKF